jgi:hypothetical protein
MGIQYYAHAGGTIEEMLDFYNINHQSHIEKHRSLLNYNISKKIFDEKVDFENQYIARLNNEGLGKIHNLEELL